MQVLRDGETVHEYFPPERGTFDESGYLAAYPDVATAVRRGLFPNGETHYERHGRKEGRRRFQEVVGQGPRAASLRWSDPPLQPGQTAAYVVRVVQANGGLAISSPVWVTGSGD